MMLTLSAIVIAEKPTAPPGHTIYNTSNVIYFPQMEIIHLFDITKKCRFEYITY